MKSTPIGLKIFIGIVILAVLAAVVTGFILAGSPTTRRAERLDNIRLNHLQNIHGSITRFWEFEGRLPESLEELKGPNYYVQSIRDPETDDLYEYRPLSEDRYELCAVFQTDSTQRRDRYPEPFSQEFWDHGAGRECYTLEAKVADPGSPSVEPRPTPPVPPR